MTGLDALKQELEKQQRIISECITEAGYVITGRRYEYIKAVKEEKRLREQLAWFRSNVAGYDKAVK